MSDNTRTAIVWVGGDRFVFRDEEVDRLLDIGADAETVPEAWAALEAYGREIEADR